MELLEKYLQAVRTLLPRKQQDDIIRELSDNLRSQIEDKEEDFGRTLTESEIADIIRRHGHPLVVAGRYRSHQHLISPTLFPFYLFVLKLGLGVALVVTCILTAVTLAMNGGGTAEVIDGLFDFPGRALMVFAWTTLSFAAFEVVQSRMKLSHNWDPRNLPKLVKHVDRISRWSALCELLATSAALAWLLLIPANTFLLFGPLHSELQLGPIWSVMYVPLVLLSLGTLALSATNVIWPYRTNARSWARLAIHFSSLVIFVALARAGGWVVVSAALSDADGAARLTTVINNGVAIGLWIAAGVSVFEIAQELRRWLSWRKAGAPDLQVRPTR